MCCTRTNAMPESDGILVKKLLRDSNPPAEEPIPTMGNFEDLSPSVFLGSLFLFEFLFLFSVSIIIFWFFLKKFIIC